MQGGVEIKAKRQKSKKSKTKTYCSIRMGTAQSTPTRETVRSPTDKYSGLLNLSKTQSDTLKMDAQ